MDDAELARRLARLCQGCERVEANDGFLLCTPCYRRRRAPVLCESCNCFTAEPICVRCDAPTTYATYEDLLEWEAKRAPVYGDRTALDAYVPTTAAAPTDTCPICLEAFGNQSVIVTRCVHTFHAECLRQWVTASVPVCPVCKLDVRDASPA